MTLPPIPKGISRDETQHGRIYYTVAQMREYGLACANVAMAETIGCIRDDKKDTGAELFEKLFPHMRNKP